MPKGTPRRGLRLPAPSPRGRPGGSGGDRRQPRGKGSFPCWKFLGCFVLRLTRRACFLCKGFGGQGRGRIPGIPSEEELGHTARAAPAPWVIFQMPLPRRGEPVGVSSAVRALQPASPGGREGSWGGGAVKGKLDLACSRQIFFFFFFFGGGGCFPRLWLSLAPFSRLPPVVVAGSRYRSGPAPPCPAAGVPAAGRGKQPLRSGRAKVQPGREPTSPLMCPQPHHSLRRAKGGESTALSLSSRGRCGN